MAFLAQILYYLRGLKLNERKTEILEIEQYRNKYLRKPEDVEKDNLIERFNELLEELNISTDPYVDIDTSELTNEERERLELFNLESLLEVELDEDFPDYGLISFLLNTLAKVDNIRVVDNILKRENIIKLLPRLYSIINYFTRIRNFSKKRKKQIGNKVLNLLYDDYIKSIPYNRMWLLHLFTENCEWNNKDNFVNLLEMFSTDNFSLRELYLALGRSRNIQFFRNNKSIDLFINSWVKRAFIAGISCLPRREREPWFKSIKRISRDFLEEIVEKWVLDNPF